MAGMQCFEARVSSFNAVTKPKRLQKVAFPLTSDTHPHLTPGNLAAAGFYHIPGPDSSSYDTCRCFLCGLELGGWDEDDDPFVEHVRRKGDCAWKKVVCSIEADRINGGPGRLRTEYPDAKSLPSSTESTMYREETFGDWWPHKKPSARKLAEAGFVSMPSRSAPDGAACPLCEYEVEAWEKDDDPWDIHYNKEPDCPFFIATVEGAVPSKGKTKATRTTKTTKKSTRKTKADSDVEMAPDSKAQPDADESVVLVEVEEAPAPKRRGRPPKASTAALSQSTASQQSTAKPKTTTRARRTTRAAAAEVVAEEAISVAGEKADGMDLDVEPEPAPKPKKTRKKKEPEPAPYVEPEPVSEPESKPKKKSTRKTKAEKEREKEAEQEKEKAAMEAESLIDDRTGVAASTSEAPVPKPTRKTKPLPTKSRGKKKAAEKQAKDDAVAGSGETESEPVRMRAAATMQSLNSEPTRPAGLTSMAATPLEKDIVNQASKSTAPVAPSTPPTQRRGVSYDVRSPSAQHSVDALLRGAVQSIALKEDDKGAAVPKPLTEADKSMTLEEYARAQFNVAQDQMRKDGEAMIAKWETTSREARARLERG